MPSRIPLGLTYQIEAPDGICYNLDPSHATAGNRLLGFSFRTKLGEGFSDASGRLARRIDLDYPDLNLIWTIRAIGADGTVAYEGRFQAMPREVGDSHSIGVTLAGWMAHAKDRKFSGVYVDRGLNGWGEPSAARRAGLLLSSINPNGPVSYTDPTDSTAGVVTGFDSSWVTPYTPIAEAWYDAGPGNLISKVAYTWKRESGAIDNTDVNWIWAIHAADDDKDNGDLNTGSLRAAGPVTSSYTPATAKRWAMLQLWYTLTSGGTDGAHYGIAWQNLAVYGNHGLTLHTGDPTQPDGIYLTDILKDIASRYCPLLDTSGVQDFPYVVQHCEFKDRTYPYDAFLSLNKYALNHLAVWENKRLVFEPYDLTDYDWEIRTDDPGTTFQAQGLSTDALFNGIVVTYEDLLTGTRMVLTPDVYTELQDTSDANPWNVAGIDAWDELELSQPEIAANALQIGRARLAETNRPKTPGQVTIKGYIRDRAGVEQPVWKVRAGDTIAITNFNEIIRLITETSYDDDGKTVTLTIDRPSPRLDALFDRLANAGIASGLA